MTQNNTKRSITPPRDRSERGGDGITASDRVAREQIVVATPFGRALAIGFANGAIVASSWVASPHATNAPRSAAHAQSDLARETQLRLTAYFARKLPVFDLPLHLEGTELEVAAWRAVATIPFGVFVPYGEVARAIERPGAHRGVARAMSLAPLALFIPAHRIVGSDGRVRGASPGSMRLKLVTFERGRTKSGVELPKRASPRNRNLV